MATGFDAMDTSDGSEQVLSDQAKQQQQLRDKYYGGGKVASPKEVPAPVEEPAPTEEEDAGVEPQPQEDLQEEVEQTVSDHPSGWQRLMTKLNRFIEDERL